MTLITETNVQSGRNSLQISTEHSVDKKLSMWWSVIKYSVILISLTCYYTAVFITFKLVFIVYFYYK